MRPAAEKTRSTPADDAGEARNCLAIFASLGHLLSCGGGVTFCVTAVAAGCAVVWRDTFGANIWLAIGLQMPALGEEPSGRAHRAEGSASAQPAQSD